MPSFAKLHDAFFYFFWRSRELFTWDGAVWADRETLARTIVVGEPSRWRIEHGKTRTSLVYQQVPMLIMPRRRISIVIQDDHTIIFSNQPWEFDVFFAYLVTSFVLIAEVFGAAQFFNLTGCGQIGCGNLLAGALVLIVAPLLMYAGLMASFWFSYGPSHSEFVRLAHELVALPGVAYRGPATAH